MAQYKKIEHLISQPAESRTTAECQEHVDWLKSKSKIFDDVKNEYLTEIIRHCKLEKRWPDGVIIKQGEKGETLYITLEGEVEIYVNQKESTAATDNDTLNQEILEAVTKAAEMPELDRNLLGNSVFVGRNKTFGEVALVEPDCIRTATVVANTPLVLLTIDRLLFNKCLKGVVAEDMKTKTDFVEKNPIFESWSSRQKRQLVISLTKERVPYGDCIIQQGRVADRLYFITNGVVEISIEPRLYRRQYSRIWSEMQSLLPQLITQSSGASLMPHEDRKHRLMPKKPKHICQLGENETLGGLEMVLELDTYIETAVAGSTVTLLRLPRTQYERIFCKRRYAAATIAKLKQHLATTLCLYIYQCPAVDSALFTFLNIRLEDADLLTSLRKALNETPESVFSGGAGTSQEQRERSEKMQEMMKRLHMPKGRELCLPAEDMAEVALFNLKKRLKAWSESCQLNGGKLQRVPQQNHVSSVG
ncbi:hypothetical protein ACOMHN_031705 [Nucella lapillus]